MAIKPWVSSDQSTSLSCTNIIMTAEKALDFVQIKKDAFFLHYSITPPLRNSFSKNGLPGFLAMDKKLNTG